MDKVEFKVGRLPDVVGTRGVVTYTSPTPFFEIFDRNVQLVDYNTTQTVTTPELFTVGNNILSFTPEMTTYFTTQSIFLPASSSPTTTQYSTVFDDCTIQPYDLIRIGPINDTACTYYNVITSSVGTPSTTTLTDGAVFLTACSIFSEPPLPDGTNSPDSTRSAIVVPNNTTNYTFFIDVANTRGKQFTVTNSTYTTPTTFTIPSNLYVQIKSDGYIYIAVSDTATPTIPNDIGSVINNIFISTNFSTLSTNAVPNLNVTLDRPVTGSGQFSQNFAILRPKPDETSVIINYRKTPGDVSQTILIPQDASDELKSKVGTIFQSLNTDLSNQNTNQ
jgi:hypothetical protein